VVHSRIPNGSKLLPIKGGLILEISEGKCRIVKQFMDEGPSGDGCWPDNVDVNEKEVWELLASGKWGLNDRREYSRL
jgi:hypothetical protein